MNFKGALFILGCSISFTLFFLPFIVVEKRDPGSTQYGFPANPFGDYYHYTYFLKSGTQGRLNFENVYTDTYQPIQFLEPHYNLFGLLSIPFGRTPGELFFLLRLLIIPFSMYVFVQLIDRTIEQKYGKLLALIVVLFSTSFWWFGTNEPELWSNMFNIFRRSATLPPHYWMTICIYIFMFFHLSHPEKTVKKFVITAFLSVNVAIMHPYLAFFLFVMITTEAAIRSLIARKIPWTLVHHIMLSGAAIAPVLLYYQMMLSVYWQSRALTMVATPRIFSIWTYALAVGPLLIGSILSLVFIKQLNTPLRRYLYVWLIVPFLLFFLPDFHIPMSPFRLFQTFQQIPAAILATLFVVTLFQKAHRFVQHGIALGVGILVIVYAIPSYRAHFMVFTDSSQPYFHHRTTIDRMRPVFTYLKDHAPAYAVVVAPDSVSSMIPSYTSTNVLIGQEGCNPHWYENKPIIDSLYGQNLTDEGIKNFLKEKNVSYIVFGVETVAFDQTRYPQSEYLKEVFKSESISVVSVDKSKL